MTDDITLKEALRRVGELTLRHEQLSRRHAALQDENTRLGLAHKRLKDTLNLPDTAERAAALLALTYGVQVTVGTAAAPTPAPNEGTKP